MGKRFFDDAGGTGTRRRFSIRALVLTGLLSVFLGVLLTLGLLFTRIGQDGLSVLQAMTVIRGQYVGDYEWETVLDETLGGMVMALDDRWSYYLSPGEYLKIQETRQNAYTGIGITISKEVGNAIKVLAVTAGSPAEEAGIQVGDAIVSIEEVSVTVETWAACVDMIRGEEGTKVTMMVRNEAGETQTVEVERREIISIPAEYEMLEGDIGLLRLYNFYSSSGAALIAGVDALVEAGAKGIIFDVRDNPGGYVTELTKMLDHLLPEGVIFQSRDTRGEETVYTSEESMVDLPFAVIVNGESYSAAEFFAAQLKESTDAAIVGETTSGKGFAQQLFPLRNGSAIGLSTSRYYTGAGVSLIGTGVTPDRAVKLTADERLSLLQGKLLPGEDQQIQAAIDALNGIR